MPVSRPLVLVLAAATAAVPLLAAPAGAAGGRPLSTVLTAAAEVPVAGDRTGKGTAEVRVNPGQRQVCYELSVTGIAPATAAHVHEAPAGAAGPVVVALLPPTDGSSSGCVTVSRELAKEILKDPADYYVNVHNAEFPGGALRGQLG